MDNKIIMIKKAMEKKDLLNYCQLAFINGINDAIAVIMLHKVFAVLMTGNIVFLVTDIATKFQFSDIVRLSLLFTFIGINIFMHNWTEKRSVVFRIILACCFVIIYIIVGTLELQYNNLTSNSWGFLLVANIATIMGVIINNMFYPLHRTKFNLVVYTVNLLNLSYSIAEKDYKEAQSLSITIGSFILGLFVASFAVRYIQFFTLIIILFVLFNLYRLNNSES